MIASDFRRTARESLSGCWLIAVLTGLVATLLTGGFSGGDSGFKINYNFGAGTNISVGNWNWEFRSFEDAIQNLPNLLFSSHLLTLLMSLVSTFFVAGILWGIVNLILGGVIDMGYARFNLDLVDQADARIETLFAYIKQFKTGFIMRLLTRLYTFLWSLLFIIPGIIARYRYAMAPYILAENPELTAKEAIAASKELMRGNKFRLFCLHFSFIGWSILASLTLGIGNLWLNPYQAAADAAFYREITGSFRQAGGEDGPWEYGNSWG